MQSRSGRSGAAAELTRAATRTPALGTSIVKRSSIGRSGRKPFVANAIDRGMTAGRRRGSSGTAIGHACLWAITSAAAAGDDR